MPLINTLRTIVGTLVVLSLLVSCGVPTTATSLPDATAQPSAIAAPEPTPEPTPEPPSITYSTPYTDGLTFYENPSEGFALVLPDKWLFVDMDKSVLEARLQAIEEQKPLQASFAREAVQKLANTGIKFYAADIHSSADAQTCTCAATINVIRKDYGGNIALSVLAPGLIRDAKANAGEGGTVEQRNVELSAGAALELTYRIQPQSGTNGHTVFTQYVLINGYDIYTITFSTTPELREEYAPVFEQISNSFRFVEQR